MSQPRYTLYIMLFVPAAERDEANQIAVEVGNGEVERNTYTTELETAGGAVWWACGTLADDAMIAAMQERMSRVPSVQFFMVSSPGDWLLSSKNEAAKASVGSVFSFEDALQVLELERVQSEALP